MVRTARLFCRLFSAAAAKPANLPFSNAGRREERRMVAATRVGFAECGVEGLTAFGVEEPCAAARFLVWCSISASTNDVAMRRVED